MHLEDPEFPFHHLKARLGIAGFQGGVKEVVNLASRGQLHPQLRHSGQRHVAVQLRAEKRGELRLHAVDKGIGPQLDVVFSHELCLIFLYAFGLADLMSIGSALRVSSLGLAIT